MQKYQRTRHFIALLPVAPISQDFSVALFALQACMWRITDLLIKQSKNRVLARNYQYIRCAWVVGKVWEVGPYLYLTKSNFLRDFYYPYGVESEQPTSSNYINVFILASSL